MHEFFFIGLGSGDCLTCFLQLKDFSQSIFFSYLFIYLIFFKTYDSVLSMWPPAILCDREIGIRVILIAFLINREDCLEGKQIWEWSVSSCSNAPELFCLPKGLAWETISSPDFNTGIAWRISGIFRIFWCREMILTGSSCLEVCCICSYKDYWKFLFDSLIKRFHLL